MHMITNTSKMHVDARFLQKFNICNMLCIFASLCRKDLNGYRADISVTQQTFGTQCKDVFIKEVNQH